jgi:galactonate dehydratase
MTRISAITAHRVAPRWIFVRVTTDDGAAGWGEAIVPKRAAAVLGAVDDLARNVVGADPGRIEELWQRMRRGGFFRDGPVLATAAAAIDHALWDIKGHRHGLPAYEFLGGAVRERVRVYAWVGGDRPSDVVTQVRARIEQGYTAVKMNATEELDLVDRAGRLDAVIARVAAIREAFGLGVDVALDFHGRVHRPMAKALLRELEQFSLMWVEEPLPPGQEDLLPGLARVSGRTPIATGERLVTAEAFARLLAGGGVDIIQPDVSLTGLFGLEKLCRMAEAYDVAVAPHCPNGPLSLAASLQVACCAGNVVIQEQSLGLHYHQGYSGLPAGEMFDYLADPAPLTPVGGELRRPSGPGLGIIINEAAVRERESDWRLPDPDWRLGDGRTAEW